MFLFYSWSGYVLLLQEWPEEVYPPYANGPAYIISSDIVTFILSQHKDRKLRVSYLKFLYPISFGLSFMKKTKTIFYSYFQVATSIQIDR